MKFRIVEERESLEKIILGIEPNVARSNFNNMLNNLPKEFQVIKETSQEPSLPKLYLNDTLILEGEYPSDTQLSELLGINKCIFENVEKTGQLFSAANEKRIGICCGVGTDVYLDPYEDD